MPSRRPHRGPHQVNIGSPADRKPPQHKIPEVVLLAEKIPENQVKKSYHGTPPTPRSASGRPLHQRHAA